jgi:hypothetical protein
MALICTDMSLNLAVVNHQTNEGNKRKVKLLIAEHQKNEVEIIV